MGNREFGVMFRPLSRFFDEDDRAAFRRATARGWRRRYYQLREGVLVAACLVESSPHFLMRILRGVRVYL